MILILQIAAGVFIAKMAEELILILINLSR